MLNFNADIPRPDDFDQPAWWFIFSGRKILTLVDPDNSRKIEGLPNVKLPDEIGIQTVRQNFLGALDGVPCWVADVEEVEGEVALPAGFKFINPRFLFNQISDDLMRIVVKSIFVCDWDRNNQYCGRCGAPMTYGTDRSNV